MNFWLIELHQHWFWLQSHIVNIYGGGGVSLGLWYNKWSCVKQLTIWPTSFINVQHDEAFFLSSSPLLLSLKVHFPLATLMLSTCHPVCLQSNLEICRFKLKIFHISYCSIVVVFREWPKKNEYNLQNKAKPCMHFLCQKMAELLYYKHENGSITELKCGGI